MKYLITTILLLYTHLSFSQKAYIKGDEVEDFAIGQVFNFKASPTTFKALQKELTVIDFFGTWCQPCIRALPHLQELQNKYKDKVQFVLVSNESEQVLKAFIQKRNIVNIPLVVDKDNIFTKLFNPTAYPYTVVVNKAGRIVAIPTTAEMTESNIESWMTTNTSTQTPGPVNKKVDTASMTGRETIQQGLVMDNKLVKLSQDFIYAAKTGSPVIQLQEQLHQLPFDTLVNQLDNDTEKKAFWINIYNGFTQLMLKNNPEQYKNRNQFFGAKLINIAGKVFSLDEIEHGILRRSKVKWGLGYINKLFPGKTEKVLRVDTVDYRIHFALNCGAKSCPPIAFYSAGKLDQQLELATTSYLTGEAEYDKEKGVVKLPAIMSWFRGDFGGKKNMISLLKDKGVIENNAKPSIQFKKYDWSLYLNNYTN